MAKNDIFDFVYMQRLREKKKITQVRLSTKVGVSHQLVMKLIKEFHLYQLHIK